MPEFQHHIMWLSQGLATLQQIERGEKRIDEVKAGLEDAAALCREILRQHNPGSDLAKTTLTRIEGLLGTGSHPVPAELRLPFYKPFRLENIPQSPEAKTMDEQMAALSGATTLGNKMGLIRSFEMHQPDVKNDRNITVHLTPILHLPPKQLIHVAHDAEVRHAAFLTEFEQYRMEKIYARFGITAVLHHEGNTVRLEKFQLSKDGRLIEGYDNEGQALLFDDLATFYRVRMQSLGHSGTINVKELLSGVTIRGTYLPENKQKRDELNGHMHCPNGLPLYYGDLISATVADLECAIRAAESYDALNQVTENEQLQSVGQTLPGNIHRVAAGAVHAKNLIKGFLDQGYPLCVTHFRSIPDDPIFQAGSIKNSARFLGAKQLLALRKSGV